MENWYENEWPYTKETGERFTKMHKEDGFTSKKELEAYNYVDSIIMDYIMELGIPNELIVNSIYPGAIIPSKKEDKLKFYEVLGLTYILEKALASSKEELEIFRKEFDKKIIENVSFEELEKRIEDYESLVNHLNNNLSALQKQLEEKRKKVL